MTWNTTLIDKVPKLDIELCNCTTRTFQSKAADATLVVSFRAVEDLIECFESTFNFYSSNIDIHWGKGKSFKTIIQHINGRNPQSLVTSHYEEKVTELS